MSSNKLFCYKCQTAVHNTGYNVAAVLCWQCCIEVLQDKPQNSKPASDKPRGWRFMKVYVHPDGTVYHKGVEQSDLKGTLPATTIKPKATVVKLTPQQKLEINIKIASLKAEMRTAKTAAKQKALEKEIRTLIKKL